MTTNYICLFLNISPKNQKSSIQLFPTFSFKRYELIGINLFGSAPHILKLDFFQIFAMQEEQYKAMLQEAEASVVHMTEVVNKYQVQVKERK